MTQFTDRATISGQARITPEGYFVADALVARANNVQTYQARELGLTDRAPDATVRVFRPETEVFAVDSLQSLARIPVTVDHPAQMVDARNWRELAKGDVGEQVMRDGEFMRITLRVTDADAVDTVLRDHKEFSLGYGADIRFEAGDHQGEAYDAIATNFRYNHLAACRAARGGPELRIVDERPPFTGAQKMPKIVMVDGLPVDVSDAAAAEQTISKLIADRATAQAEATDAKAALGTAETTVAARDAEIVTLKDAAKAAEVTPQQLRDAARSYAVVVANAKALGATVTDAMDEAEVRKAAVAHKMGDKAAAYTPEQVVVAFDMLVDGLGDKAATAATAQDSLRDVIIATPTNLGDGATAFADARRARFERLGKAHRAPASAAA